MSNAVDMLMCDGPLAGKRYCVQRPVPATLECANMDAQGAVVTYHTVKYEDVYWVAVIDPEDLSAIPAMIADTGWQPSWDLLREQGQHP